jgi:4-hydroxybenzoate polyprenyltransferase
LLLAAGITVAALLVPPRFGIELLIYFAITLAYSFWIKRVVILDVVTLAGLYTVRVLAGGAATGIPISPWLLAFSAFLFLSLAMMKRFAELRTIQALSGVEVKGRDYNVGDIDLLNSVGPASGLLCILVLALYVNSPDVALLYRSPLGLWLIHPFLLYWIIRLWLLAHRGLIVGDPIVFTARDRVSYIVGACILAIIAGASLF